MSSVDMQWVTKSLLSESITWISRPQTEGDAHFWYARGAFKGFLDWL
jgi:hypothetical protein